MRIERHHSGVWVREDGCVYLPQSGRIKAHWTFGSKTTYGYLRVCINGKNHRVHRLVAETFIPNPEEKPEVDHIDRCPTHNNVQNLRWATSSENHRNTSHNDRVDARGDTHYYENREQYKQEWDANYRTTHKCVIFSDGKRRWLPNEQAVELLKLSVKERHYGNG